jgi:hypothetical protein
MPWDVKRTQRASATIAAFTSTSESLGVRVSGRRGRSRAKSPAVRVAELCESPIRNEYELQKIGLEMMKLLGWKTSHFKAAKVDGRWMTPLQGDAKGFVDVVAARDRIIYVEFKGAAGKVEPEQQVWHDCLRRAGGEVYVIRPNDIHQLAQVLR